MQNSNEKSPSKNEKKPIHYLEGDTSYLDPIKLDKNETKYNVDNFVDNIFANNEKKNNNFLNSTKSVSLINTNNNEKYNDLPETNIPSPIQKIDSKNFISLIDNYTSVVNNFLTKCIDDNNSHLISEKSNNLLQKDEETINKAFEKIVSDLDDVMMTKTIQLMPKSARTTIDLLSKLGKQLIKFNEKRIEKTEEERKKKLYGNKRNNEEDVLYKSKGRNMDEHLANAKRRAELMTSKIIDANIATTAKIDKKQAKSATNIEAEAVYTKAMSLIYFFRSLINGSIDTLAVIKRDVQGIAESLEMKLQDDLNENTEKSRNVIISDSKTNAFEVVAKEDTIARLERGINDLQKFMEIAHTEWKSISVQNPFQALENYEKNEGLPFKTNLIQPGKINEIGSTIIASSDDSDFINQVFSINSNKLQQKFFSLLRFTETVRKQNQELKEKAEQTLKLEHANLQLQEEIERLKYEITQEREQKEKMVNNTLILLGEKSSTILSSKTTKNSTQSIKSKSLSNKHASGTSSIEKRQMSQQAIEATQELAESLKGIREAEVIKSLKKLLAEREDALKETQERVNILEKENLTLKTEGITNMTTCSPMYCPHEIALKINRKALADEKKAHNKSVEELELTNAKIRKEAQEKELLYRREIAELTLKINKIGIMSNNENDPLISQQIDNYEEQIAQLKHRINELTTKNHGLLQENGLLRSARSDAIGQLVFMQTASKTPCKCTFGEEGSDQMKKILQEAERIVQEERMIFQAKLIEKEKEMNKIRTELEEIYNDLNGIQ